MERKSDAKKASDNIESHSHPKSWPIEMERSKEAKEMHGQHNSSSANIQRVPFPPKEDSSLSLHLNLRQQNLSVFQCHLPCLQTFSKCSIGIGFGCHCQIIGKGVVLKGNFGLRWVKVKFFSGESTVVREGAKTKNGSM